MPIDYKTCYPFSQPFAASENSQVMHSPPKQMQLIDNFPRFPACRKFCYPLGIRKDGISSQTREVTRMRRRKIFRERGNFFSKQEISKLGLPRLVQDPIL